MEQLGFAQQQGSSGGAALSTSKSSTSFGEEIADSDMNRQGREPILQLLTKKGFLFLYDEIFCFLYFLRYM